MKIVPRGSPSASGRSSVRGSPRPGRRRRWRSGVSGTATPARCGRLGEGGWGGAGGERRAEGVPRETPSQWPEGWGRAFSLSLSVQFTTTVVSCSPAELQTEGSNGKKEVLSGFHVVLEDTLLFPEGGGQVPGPRLTPIPSQEALHSFLLRWEMSSCPSAPAVMSADGSSVRVICLPNRYLSGHSICWVLIPGVRIRGEEGSICTYVGYLSDKTDIMVNR